MSVPPRVELPVTQLLPPPFPVIGAHFAAAAIWAVAGGLGLIGVGPDLAQGAFLSPRVLAVTHLFTLGWMTTVITGVLHQIFPAFLGIAPRSVAAIRGALLSHTAGVAALVAGLLTGRAGWQGAGWLLIGAAVLGTVWNLLSRRHQAARNRQLGSFVAAAFTNLGLAMVIAAVRIGDGLGLWTSPRLPLLAAHFHLAAAGFATMVAFGAGSRMIPMFLSAVGPAEESLRWVPGLLGSGTVVFGAGMVCDWPAAVWLGAVLMVIAAARFLALAAQWSRSRTRRVPDPASGLILMALTALTLALPTGVAALASGAGNPQLLISYVVLLILGWLTSLILGVSFRVVPTLIWHHRFAARMGRPGTPTLPALLMPPVGWAVLGCHGLGLVGLVTGILGGQGRLSQGSAVLITMALGLTALHHLRIALHRGSGDPRH
jgi:hypothetical protein